MTEDKRSFEERLQEVQETISRIEEGKLSLEDSVRRFEEGMKTLSSLEDELKEMNRRLTVLQGGTEQPLTVQGEQDEDL